MENKKAKNTIVLQTIIAFILCFILLVVLVFQFSQIWNLNQEQTQLQNKIESIQKQNSFYSDQLDYYASDDFLEDSAHAYNKYNPNKGYYKAE